ncbi:PREDICTED: uncharacterized protein LOC108551397 [Eufriesea mexicana]|uniref:uncharacterized protein LOC108551397 n=1 Tax=Eufriesea mexicana TaxID=516756 RepID=UPI00083BBCCF|nr:PREDICTED: uncharacterized protein LOC108551397 [Eufriesea mexicana]
MRLVGWRYAAFIGTFVAIVGTCSYFTMISPMINPEPYKQIREYVAQVESKKNKKEI